MISDSTTTVRYDCTPEYDNNNPIKPVESVKRTNNYYLGRIERDAEI